MTSPLSPTIPSLESWMDEQDSPKVLKFHCECLCHSRKFSMIMLENLDKQNAVLVASVDRIDKLVQELMKVMEEFANK